MISLNAMTDIEKVKTYFYKKTSYNASVPVFKSKPSLPVFMLKQMN